MTSDLNVIQHVKPAALTTSTKRDQVNESVLHASALLID
jgi:hypothetical protein